jgi:fructose/tagatose bisphosphate aldolase
MPIATPEIYAERLDRARDTGYAYPAINCTLSETINAALRGFADAGSDGFIQISTGGAEFGSGCGGAGSARRAARRCAALPGSGWASWRPRGPRCKPTSVR